MRNSKLGFLRRQHNYFLLDGLTHLTNLFLNSPSTVGLPLYCLWIIAFVIHMHYYRNLKTNPPPKPTGDGQIPEDNKHKIPRIFHWSCVEYSANRFSILESGREILETAADVTAHTAGFYLAFQMLQSFWYRVASLAIMSAILYRQMLTLKYFLTDPKMMPPVLRRWAATFSGASVSN